MGKELLKNMYLSLKQILIYSVVLGLILLGGCTVFEDRDGCPNYLQIDLQEVDKNIKEWQMWLFNEEGTLILKDTIYRRSYSAPYIVQVPRFDSVKCLLWGNMRSATNLMENYSYTTYLEKLEDVSADSLYFFTETINTKGENSYMKVLPEKEFATVDIYVKGWVGTDYEADMVLECASSGFYVSGELLNSKSFTDVKIHDMGTYYTHFRCRMWRQQDTENIVLKLFIRDLQPDGTLGNILVDNEIPIGEYLFENGYDMYSPSLADISMEVDYSYNRFMIRADDWEATYKILAEI